MTEAEKELEWQALQSRVVETMDRRMRRAIIKTLAEELPEHREALGLLTVLWIRTLLHAVARLVAMLAHDDLTSEAGALRLRPVLEGISLLERSELGELSAEVRRTLVAALPDAVAAASAKGGGHARMTDEIREMLFDAIMVEDDADDDGAWAGSAERG